MKLRTKETIRAVALAAVGLAFLVPTAVQAQTGSFTFSQSRPRLVVLLHGVTPKPQEDEEAKRAGQREAKEDAERQRTEGGGS